VGEKVKKGVSGVSGENAETETVDQRANSCREIIHGPKRETIIEGVS